MLGFSLLAHLASSTDDSSLSVVENKQTSDSRVASSPKTY